MTLLAFASSCSKLQQKQLIPEMDDQTVKSSETTAYYWQHGEKIPLQKIGGKYHVAFYTLNENSLKAELAKINIELINEKEIKELSYYSIDMTGFEANVKKFTNYKTATIEGNYRQIATIMDSALYWSPYYRMTNGLEIGISNLFFVELKPDITIEQLKQLAEKCSVDIIGADNSLKGWYYLACTNSSKGNALEMANLFYESDLFLEACPDFFGAGSI